MMKKNKSLVFTTIIFAILIVVMGSYIVYDNFIKKDENIDNNNSAEVMEYTYEGIKGVYTYKSETMTNEFGAEYFAYYYLYLHENGTFNYKMGTAAPFGYIGNYVIKDNTIVLNYLFSTNSGAAINVTTGSKTITITDNNTLVDDNPSVTVDDMTNVTLKKASSAEESSYENFSHILNNYYLINNTNNN